MKNWVLTITVIRPFEEEKVNLRHYLNGVTNEQAIQLTPTLVNLHAGDGYIVGVSLSENHTRQDD